MIWDIIYSTDSNSFTYTSTSINALYTCDYIIHATRGIFIAETLAVHRYQNIVEDNDLKILGRSRDSYNI